MSIQISKTTSETPAQVLVKELQTLNIPRTATKHPGWLRRYYLGVKGWDLSALCPELTQLLLNKFHRGEFSALTVKEWFELLDDAEALYPKYRA